MLIFVLFLILKPEITRNKIDDKRMFVIRWCEIVRIVKYNNL